MLTLNYIRENLEKIKKNTAFKNRKVDFELLLKTDEKYRESLTKVNLLRAERNKLAKQGNKPENIIRGREIKIELKQIEEKNDAQKKQIDELILSIPNLAYDEVPAGIDEKMNKEIKRVGEPPKFDFKFLSHIELIKKHDLADLERGNKVAGYRGYFLKNQLAVLHFAVLFYAFQKLIHKGYTPLIAPSLVKGFGFFGNGQFPWGKDEVYNLEKDNLYLSGTAEVPVTAYFANEILLENDLPKKFVAFSPCFRREIGSYGKDTQGLYRVHEFWKVEQVVLSDNSDEKARELHEELLKNTEEILADFGLPYRLLLMCTGDMGEPQAKKYDLEIWMPYKNGYGEIASNSIMTDFQSNRLKIRYRTKLGELKNVYTLNNTAIASPRVLISLLENNQQMDGSIKIPKVLQSLCGFSIIK